MENQRELARYKEFERIAKEKEETIGKLNKDIVEMKEEINEYKKNIE